MIERNIVTRISSKEFLYAAFRLWCKEKNRKLISKERFIEHLRARGFADGKEGRSDYFIGLSIKPGIKQKVVTFMKEKHE